MTSKGSKVPRVLPKTQRVAAEAEGGAGADLVAYLRGTSKEKIAFNLSADICEAIRDHARPLRMPHSEIVERGVRMFFRSELIDVLGPVDG